MMPSALRYAVGASHQEEDDAASRARRRLPLRANFSWTLAGNIVNAGCQWGTVVVLSKLGTPEMVGQFALGFAVTAPIVLFANLGLGAVQATDAKRLYGFGDYLGLRILTTVLALIVVAAIAAGSGYRRETALVVLAVGVYKAFEAISDIFYGLLQQHERMDRMAKSLMYKGLFSILAMAVGLYLTRSVFWAVLGMALVMAIRLVAYDVPSGRMMLEPHSRAIAGSGMRQLGRLAATVRPRWNLSALARLALLSLPLGVTAMLSSLATNMPRYFIERQLGERELGLFAAVAYMLTAGGTVVNALGQSASPRLAKYYADGKRAEFQKLILRLVATGAVLGLLGVLSALLAGAPLLSLLYSPEYAQHADVLVWLMVAATASYAGSFLGYAMTAARRFQPQLPIFLAVAGSTAFGCLLLVPSWGLLGAAFALIVSSLVNCGLSAHVVRRALCPLQVPSAK